MTHMNEEQYKALGEILKLCREARQDLRSLGRAMANPDRPIKPTVSAEVMPSFTLSKSPSLSDLSHNPITPSPIIPMTPPIPISTPPILHQNRKLSSPIIQTTPSTATNQELVITTVSKQAPLLSTSKVTSPPPKEPPDPPDSNQLKLISGIEDAHEITKAPRLRNKRGIPLKYSCQEIYERMENGLCIFCEEKDTLDHQLKHKGLLIFIDDQLSDDIKSLEYAIEEAVDKSTERVPIASDNEEKKTVSHEDEHAKTAVDDSSSLQNEHQEDSVSLIKSLNDIKLSFSHGYFDFHISVLSSLEMVMCISGRYCNEEEHSDCLFPSYRVWEPGGLLTKLDMWDWTEKCLSHGQELKLNSKPQKTCLPETLELFVQPAKETWQWTVKKMISLEILTHDSEKVNNKGLKSRTVLNIEMELMDFTRTKTFKRAPKNAHGFDKKVSETVNLNGACLVWLDSGFNSENKFPEPPDRNKNLLVITSSMAHWLMISEEKVLPLILYHSDLDEAPNAVAVARYSKHSITNIYVHEEFALNTTQKKQLVSNFSKDIKILVLGLREQCTRSSDILLSIKRMNTMFYHDTGWVTVSNKGDCSKGSKRSYKRLFQRFVFIEKAAQGHNTLMRRDVSDYLLLVSLRNGIADADVVLLAKFCSIDSYYKACLLLELIYMEFIGGKIHGNELLVAGLTKYVELEAASERGVPFQVTDKTISIVQHSPLRDICRFLMSSFCITHKNQISSHIWHRGKNKDEIVILMLLGNIFAKEQKISGGIDIIGSSILEMSFGSLRKNQCSMWSSSFWRDRHILLAEKNMTEISVGGCYDSGPYSNITSAATFVDKCSSVCRIWRGAFVMNLLAEQSQHCGFSKFLTQWEEHPPDKESFSFSSLRTRMFRRRKYCDRNILSYPV